MIMRCIFLAIALAITWSEAKASLPQESFKRSFPTPTRLVAEHDLRGGGFHIPLDPEVEVDAANMALALRWTAEINRRLQDSAEKVSTVAAAAEPQSLKAGARESRSNPIPRGGAGFAFRIPEKKNSRSVATTVFHAQSPRIAKNGDKLFGAHRWGPNLETFIAFLQDALQLSTLDLVVSMIYLDRACSVETPRSMGGSPTPFCTPRTLHRLVLASMVLAKQRRNTNLSMQTIWRQIKPLGIPKDELLEMVQSMKSALGDVGMYVSSYQFRDFEQTWNGRFPARPHSGTAEGMAKTEPATLVAEGSSSSSSTTYYEYVQRSQSIAHIPSPSRAVRS